MPAALGGLGAVQHKCSQGQAWPMVSPPAAKHRRAGCPCPCRACASATGAPFLQLTSPMCVAMLYPAGPALRPHPLRVLVRGSGGGCGCRSLRAQAAVACSRPRRRQRRVCPPTSRRVAVAMQFCFLVLTGAFYRQKQIHNFRVGRLVGSTECILARGSSGGCRGHAPPWAHATLPPVARPLPPRRRPPFGPWPPPPRR